MPETPHSQPRGADRVAIVTGGTGAIGSATAERLLRSGWRVALVGRDADRPEAIAQRLGPARLLRPSILRAGWPSVDRLQLP